MFVLGITARARRHILVGLPSLIQKGIARVSLQRRERRRRVIDQPDERHCVESLTRPIALSLRVSSSRVSGAGARASMAFVGFPLKRVTGRGAGREVALLAGSNKKPNKKKASLGVHASPHAVFSPFLFSRRETSFGCLKPFSAKFRTTGSKEAKN